MYRLLPSLPKFPSFSLAALVSLSLLACAPRAATPPAALTSAWAHIAPRPARERTFSVKVTGHGRPVVLIPGLACNGEVWNDFVRHYADRYEMHVLTLAGFGGEQAVSDSTLAAVRADVARYIREAGLQGTVVVGHSLGGFLAFALAEREPDLVAAVVAVDGVPFLPALMNPGATPEAMVAPARRIAASIAEASPDAFRAQNRAAARTMVTDPAQAERIAAWGAASDARTVGAAMAEVMTTDLRPDEGRIRAPALLVAAAQEAQSPESRAALSAAYEAQVAGVPDHRVVLAENARHFVMLDDPSFLYTSVDALLARIAPTEASR